MQYRVNPKNGDRLSALGFGNMRLPRKGAQIDSEKVAAQVKAAVDLGINYFDTAYIYPGSEEALGAAFAATGLRDRVHIATKLPPPLIRSAGDIDRIFEKQLLRLRTDHVDYYLMHMLDSVEAWDRLRGFGIEAWIDRQKASGRVRNIGFSFHGGYASFAGLIDAYAWDFCMIQYNYLDENNQAGKAGLQYAAAKGLPVFVMEPLRGGLLATGLPGGAREAFARVDRNRTPPDWGLRWVLNHPEVTVALSGMSEIAQLSENAAIASRAEAGALTGEELSAYAKAVSVINQAIRVPCTACRYCMPCPKGVDIPSCFAAYNESYIRGFRVGMMRYFMTTGAMSPNPRNASRCVGCRKCESHCPQHIEISARLGDVKRRCESFWYRPLTAVARRVMRIRKSTKDKE